MLQVRLRELKVDLLAGELLVDGAEGLVLVLNVCLLGLVQVHLEQAGSVQLNPDPLTHDLGRVDQVVQDRVVHRLHDNTKGVEKIIAMMLWHKLLLNNLCRKMRI